MAGSLGESGTCIARRIGKTAVIVTRMWQGAELLRLFNESESMICCILLELLALAPDIRGDSFIEEV